MPTDGKYFNKDIDFGSWGLVAGQNLSPNGPTGVEFTFDATPITDALKGAVAVISATELQAAVGIYKLTILLQGTVNTTTNVGLAIEFKLNGITRKGFFTPVNNIAATVSFGEYSWHMPGGIWTITTRNIRSSGFITSSVNSTIMVDRLRY